MSWERWVERQKHWWHCRRSLGPLNLHPTTYSLMWTPDIFVSLGPNDLQPHLTLFSVYAIILAIILERVAISSSIGSSRPRDWTWVSCNSSRVLHHWPPEKARLLDSRANTEQEPGDQMQILQWPSYDIGRTWTLESRRMLRIHGTWWPTGDRGGGWRH